MDESSELSATGSYSIILSFRLFKECPEAKTLFGFPIDIDTDSAELLESKRFIMHSSYLIQMLDSALNMLGPDIEMLTEIMTDLGKKHVAYMVTPEMYPIFGESRLHAIATLLGDQFTDVTQQAWQEVYNDLTADMIRSYQDK